KAAIERTLGQFLRFPMAAALPPNECVEWPPVDAAKFFEGLMGRRRFTLRGQHHAPMSGNKSAATVLQRLCRTTHSRPDYRPAHERSRLIDAFELDARLAPTFNF